jgi:hypothetical protein
VAGGQQINVSQGTLTADSPESEAVTGSESTTATGSVAKNRLHPLRSRKTGGGSATFALSGIASAVSAGIPLSGASRTPSTALVTLSQGAYTKTRTVALTGSQATSAQGTMAGSGGSVAAGTWAARSTGAGVVWAHNFASSNEITAHLRVLPTDEDSAGSALSPSRVTDPLVGSAMRYITLGSRLKQAYTAGGATMVLEDATYWPDPAASGTYTIHACENSAAMPQTHNLFLVTAKSGNTISVTYIPSSGQPFTTTQLSFPAGSIVGHQNGDKWSRVFSALKADSSGRGVDDINNAGNVLRSKYDQTNFPYGGSVFGYGWYGSRQYWDTATNPSAQFVTWRPSDYGAGAIDSTLRSNLWDGDEFYIQFRVRIDPRFHKNTNLVAYDDDNRWSRKIFMLQSEATVPQQLVVNYRPGSQRYYIPSTKEFPFILNTSSHNGGLSTRSISADGIGGGSLQPGSQWESTAEYATNQAAGTWWEWPAGVWVTFLLHVKPGTHWEEGTSATPHKNSTVEVKIALDGDSAYTTVISSAIQALIFGSNGNNQGLWYGAVPGYNVLEPTGYLNVDLGSLPPAYPYTVDFSEFIFSKQSIAIPQAAPAISVSGNIWTPHRNAAGEFYVSQLRQLTQNQWYFVGGTDSMMDTVIQTPRYGNTSGSDGSPGIVTAWGGAAWDPIQQRMFITGGGHVDTSGADTGVYQLEASTLKFTRIVDRQPLASTLKPTGGPASPCSALIAGEPFEGGDNYPLTTGVPSTQHTYNGIPWITPEAMQGLGFVGNIKGGMFLPGRAKAVVNLDNGQYSKIHFVCNAAGDASYMTAFVDGNIVYSTHGGGAFNWKRWDMSQTETTSWQTSGYDPSPGVPSFGKDLSLISHSATFLNNHRAYCWMRERREIVSFWGNQNATRIRYGAAIDAGATDWTAYCDTITLTGAGAADFTSANLQDQSGGNVLSQTAGAYDHYEDRTSATAGGAIWLQGNTLGSQLYKITGLSTNSWTVTKIAGTGALASGVAGTYGRFQVASIGGTKFALRVTSTTGQLQIMRLN